MIILFILLVALIVIATLGAIALCKASAPDDAERIFEDEEQMRYLREWKSKGRKV